MVTLGKFQLSPYWHLRLTSISLNEGGVPNISISRHGIYIRTFEHRYVKNPGEKWRRTKA